MYALGATMYMPGTKDISRGIIEKKYLNVGTIVMCFEDAIDISELEKAEHTVEEFLNTIRTAIEIGDITYDELPLIILRVRSVEQFVKYTNKLSKENIKLLTGFNFPKFSSKEGKLYFDHLRLLNLKHEETFYGMPILESIDLARSHTRIDELLQIKKIIDDYKDIVLNIRVGATDFSSYFGLRRNVKLDIYDIHVVNSILVDIANVFMVKDDNYVISGPVWEYFDVKKYGLESSTPYFIRSILSGIPVFSFAIDGLIRETYKDINNGFVGKTVIHPSQVNIVNGLYTVIKEDYDDAVSILQARGGVIKSDLSNKMNEVNPHTRWATKIVNRAKIFGVVHNEGDLLNLLW
jgi:citrate lyase beta subunit